MYEDEASNLNANENNEKIYNDDLFIKRRYEIIPEKIDRNEQRLKEIVALGKKLKIEYYDSNVLSRGVTFDEYCSDRHINYKIFREANERLRKIEEEKKLDGSHNTNAKDYSGTEDFWSFELRQDDAQGAKYCLKQMGSIVSNAKYYHGFKSLNRSFISLIDFLNNAKYIGRYLKRTKVGFGYMSEDKRCFVLYMYDNIAICRVTYDDILTGDYVDQYVILSSQYLEDGYYEFYGDCIESFDDRQAVYNEIFNQVYDHNPSYEEKSRIK
jgi:hypothetical protein